LEIKRGKKRKDEKTFRDRGSGLNEKTISIRVSGLKNYCPIFYGRSCRWVVDRDIPENF